MRFLPPAPPPPPIPPIPPLIAMLSRRPPIPPPPAQLFHAIMFKVLCNPLKPANAPKPAPPPLPDGLHPITEWRTRPPAPPRAAPTALTRRDPAFERGDAAKLPRWLPGDREWLSPFELELESSALKSKPQNMPLPPAPPSLLFSSSVRGRWSMKLESIGRKLVRRDEAPLTLNFGMPGCMSDARGPPQPQLGSSNSLLSRRPAPPGPGLLRIGIALITDMVLSRRVSFGAP